MAGYKGVVDALAGFGKAGQAVHLAQRGELLPPSGEDLMDVALMAHIKYQPVPGRVEHPVDRHRQLHNAQVGRQMAAGLRNLLNEK